MQVIIVIYLMIKYQIKIKKIDGDASFEWKYPESKSVWVKDMLQASANKQLKYFFVYISHNAFFP